MMHEVMCMLSLTFLFVVIFLTWICTFVPAVSHEAVHIRTESPPYPDGSSTHLSWFVQLSDLHISKFNDPPRMEQLQAFVSSDLLLINPKAVIVTGDLTDAKERNLVGSGQYEEEWKHYDAIVKNTNITWLDLRGNHDVFNVLDKEDDHNYFNRYGVQKKSHSYSHHYVSKEGDTISFIALDATPVPGPRRPFNFFGILDQKRIDEIIRLSKERPSNTTIWFAHYPSSIIFSPVPVEEIVSPSGVAYLCGHLHTLGGLVTEMYTTHSSGLIELELGDWKDNRLFRVFAVDHGMFSFVDVSYKTWPIVLITNPKNVKYQNDVKEPLGRVHNSTHVRVLLFSPTAVTSVSVYIDDMLIGNAQKVDGALYVVPWKPRDFAHGVHTIVVTVRSSDGSIKHTRQRFSLDHRLASGLQSSYILQANHVVVLRLFFCLAFFFSVIPLFLCRFCNIYRYISYNSWLPNCVVSFCKNYHVMLQSNSIFYPMALFQVYTAVGPWFMGAITSRSVGICFVFGLYVEGYFLSGSLTWIYGFFQYLTFNFPMQVYLVASCNHCTPIVDVSLLLVLCSWQWYLAFTGTYQAYGGVAFFTCIPRTWAPFLLLWLRFKVYRLCSKMFQTSLSRSSIKVR